MAFRDLRDWIDYLETVDELRRVRVPVDWDQELGAITRYVSSRGGPALLFENVMGYEKTRCRRLFTNGTGTRTRVCHLLGLPSETGYPEIVKELKTRFHERIEPVVVETGEVHDHVLTGEAVDLYQFPAPRWNLFDGGRYIMTSASVVTRDPDTGELNVGTYRGMIATSTKVSVLLATTQGWGKHFSKYMQRGQEMPVAVVLGTEPSLFLAASTPLPYPEFAVAGGLRRMPVNLVRCRTSDLLVPSSAEIVLEGRISPDPRSFEPEGPFGEYPGYYGGRSSPKHAIRVECITHREDPILTGCLTGASPGRLSEVNAWTGATFSTVAWHYLEHAGVPGVTGVWRGKWPEILRVQIRKSHRGHAQQVANALWGTDIAHYAAKHLIVVDDDIDIFDWEAIEWALAYRVNAGMGDISFFPNTSGSMLDPSVPVGERDALKYGHGKWTRVLVDATINWELEPQERYQGQRYPPLATVYAPEIEERVRRRWKEYGL